jgi:hypothetical protein
VQLLGGKLDQLARFVNQLADQQEARGRKLAAVTKSSKRPEAKKP